MNVIEDINDVDIIELCDFILYFDDERWWDGLLEMIFDDGLDDFVGSKISSRLIVFRFTSWSCDILNDCLDGDVVDTWIEGNDIVNIGTNKLFCIGHS